MGGRTRRGLPVPSAPTGSPTVREGVAGDPAVAEQRSQRERRGLRAAKRLESELVGQLGAHRYDPVAFDRVLQELLSRTNDHWEQLELRRRCAGAQLALAVLSYRGISEITRLFAKQRRLGYSSLNDECNHLCLYAGAMAGRGRRAASRALLRGFLDRVSTSRKEATFMQGYLTREIRRV